MCAVPRIIQHMNKVPSPAFRRPTVLLIIAISAHNFEEWLTFPHFGQLDGIMRQRLGLNVDPKPWPIVQGGLVFVTVVPAILLMIGQQTTKSWGTWVTCWIAAIFFANVFVPHIPAMMLFRGYAPGGLTATLVILPLALLILRQARSENLLTNGQLGLAILAGFLSLFPAIQLAYAVSGLFLA